MISFQSIGNPSYFKCYRLYDGYLVYVHIYDTAGHEKFKAINESYYKKETFAY